MTFGVVMKKQTVPNIDIGTTSPGIGYFYLVKLHFHPRTISPIFRENKTTFGPSYKLPHRKLMPKPNWHVASWYFQQTESVQFKNRINPCNNLVISCANLKLVCKTLLTLIKPGSDKKELKQKKVLKHVEGKKGKVTSNVARQDCSSHSGGSGMCLTTTGRALDWNKWTWTFRWNCLFPSSVQPLAYEISLRMATDQGVQ